jgi:predicted dinucleotide-binding enzyme
MKVAIIGTGNVGSALGSTLVKAGHEVVLTARDTARTQDAARAIGASAAASLAEAVTDVDVIVLAVPFSAAREVAMELAPLAAGKVVVDATNPLKPDYSGLATVDPSGAELVAATLPGARVAKAFNTVFAGLQADPDALGQRLDVLIATDDRNARDTVALLATSAGFRPVAVGPLAAARELEALAWLNIRLQMNSQGSWNTAVTLVAPPKQAVVNE